MPLIRVKKNFQITIPTALRNALKIAVGDYLEVERQDCELILKPVKLVHPDQAYFSLKSGRSVKRGRTRQLPRARC